MPETTTPAETLRKAAALMRELACAASEGPWKSWVEGRDHQGGDSMIGTADEDGGDLYVRVGAGHHPKWVADQDYIASMHPQVGLALARWLEAEAGRASGMDGREDSDAYPMWLETFDALAESMRVYRPSTSIAAAHQAANGLDSKGLAVKRRVINHPIRYELTAAGRDLVARIRSAS